MEEEQKRILSDVFGDSSDSEGDEQRSGDPIHRDGDQSRTRKVEINPSWQQIVGISGLWLCRDFLSPERQSLLLSAIENEGWFAEAYHNQAMRFGDLPPWAAELSKSIHEVVCLGGCSSNSEDFASNGYDKQESYLMPSALLWREPLFDQLIVNVYQPGEGICGHVDLMRFDDGIAIVSLESTCVMHFTRVKKETRNPEIEETEDPPMTKVPVFLTPGSLILMWGEARYLWKHEINRKPGFQIWEGQEIHQKKRTSVTLRKLCQLTEAC